MEAFAYNEIKNVIIPDTVSVLEPGAFKENQIVEVKIGKNIDTIPSRCFYNNKIKTLEISLGKSTNKLVAKETIKRAPSRILGIPFLA